MTFEELQRVSARENIRVPTAFDALRMKRAQLFASKVMFVIERFCNDQAGARDALIAAAYDADVEINSCR